jgi:hypothetical protein
MKRLLSSLVLLLLAIIAAVPVTAIACSERETGLHPGLRIHQFLGDSTSPGREDAEPAARVPYQNKEKR